MASKKKLKARIETLEGTINWKDIRLESEIERRLDAESKLQFLNDMFDIMVTINEHKHTDIIDGE